MPSCCEGYTITKTRASYGDTDPGVKEVIGRCTYNKGNNRCNIIFQEWNDPSI